MQVLLEYKRDSKPGSEDQNYIQEENVKMYTDCTFARNAPQTIRAWKIKELYSQSYIGIIRLKERLGNLNLAKNIMQTNFSDKEGSYIIFPNIDNVTQQSNIY